MTHITKTAALSVPFFRASISEAEISEVVECLRSGWLTTGPRTKQFEQQFSKAVGTEHAVAVNSCTAALHLAVEALHLSPGDIVLVPTMTFAATAEIVRYQGAKPLLVDCEADSLNMDLNDAEDKLAQLRAGRLPFDPASPVVGIIPVHVGGAMMDMDAVGEFASRHGLWIVEDSAHALPAAYRANPATPWKHSGANTASVTCFSFYANKTITTGEGGMAVTADGSLADRMRQMSLHGLSQDAWNRFGGGKSWDYRIVAPGYKYNLTDIASAIGLNQLARAEEFRRRREELAANYLDSFSDIFELELPQMPQDRIHSWHLFPVRLHLDRLCIDRNVFKDELKERGINSSVHWRPLHLHPYYEETFGWTAESLPVASQEWERLLSLPLFPSMTADEQEHVILSVREICARYRSQSVTKHVSRRPR